MKDYRDVLIRPVITEQSVAAMEDEGKYTFEVPKQTNKIEVRQAVENLFGVIAAVGHPNGRGARRHLDKSVPHRNSSFGEIKSLLLFYP